MLVSTLLTPLLAFCGALIAVFVALRGARQLEHRSLREETLRSLRWAAELAVDADPTRAVLGAGQLVALDSRHELNAFELAMVKAALDSMEPPPVEPEE